MTFGRLISVHGPARSLPLAWTCVRTFAPAPARLFHTTRWAMSGDIKETSACNDAPKTETKPSSATDADDAKGSAHDFKYMQPEELRRRILAASLPFVPEFGWKTDCIAKGAQSLGLPGTAHGLCEGGPRDLLEYFLQDCSTRLRERLHETDMGRLPGITARVRLGIETRLDMTKPVIGRWPEALAMGATDPNTATVLLHALATDCDEIWFHAGDVSTDFNWYTKRASLAAVYSATELFMTQDTSPDFVDTRAFLENRLHDLYNVSMARKTVEDTIAGSAQVAWALSQTMQNMLGFNRQHR